MDLRGSGGTLNYSYSAGVTKTPVPTNRERTRYLGSPYSRRVLTCGQLHLSHPRLSLRTSLADRAVSPGTDRSVHACTGPTGLT